MSIPSNVVRQEALPVSEIDGFFGELIRPNDPGHDDVRRTWNGVVVRCFASWIARPTSTA